MNILLTGATGFIGSNLINRLAQIANVHILYRPSSDIAAYSKYDSYCFDGNPESLVEYIRAKSIDGIIHLASLCIINHTPEQIEDLLASNITFPMILIDSAVRGGVKWFLNTGSIWQNYNSEPQSDAYNPVNLYAATKQAFIDMAKYYTETSDIRFATLKLCDTYGPGDKRRKIVALFKENAESGTPLDMSPGEQLMDILHIDDVVEGFMSVMKVLSDPGKPYRPEYTLNAYAQIPLKELAKIFESTNHVHLNINWGGREYRTREVMHPYRGNHPPEWSPEIDINEGLAMIKK